MKLVNGAPSSGDDPERSEAGQPRDGEILGPAGGALQQTALAGVAAPERGAHGLARCLPPAAPFLAQLIATAQQAPQTRARRRAEPADAAALYAGGHARRAAGRTRQKSWLM
jgi:hypothetical protein